MVIIKLKAIVIRLGIRTIRVMILLGVVKVGILLIMIPIMEQVKIIITKLGHRIRQLPIIRQIIPLSKEE